MRSRWRAAGKTGVRKIIRAAGYELTPLAAGMPEVQRRLLRDCSTVVDVGANVGQFAERVRALGHAGRIVSFEPGSEAFAILSRKAARDRLWEVRQVALGDTPGAAVLRLSRNSVSSSLLDVGDTHLAAAPDSEVVGRQSVRVSTLGVEVEDLDDRDLFVKLDVQGFEMQVLAGAGKALERVRVIQVEVSFDNLYDGQSEWLEICEFLQKRGFGVSYLEPGYENRKSGTMLQADFVFVRRAR